MKSLKLSFDFSDHAELVESLRLLAAQEKTSQKAIVIEALQAFFGDKLESDLILRAASQSFSEWENEEDRVYDTL